VAFFAQRTARLNTRIIKLGGLADHNWA
jgi:hypothetical protein